LGWGVKQKDRGENERSRVGGDKARGKRARTCPKNKNVRTMMEVL